MTQVRYWAITLAIAICGALIAIDRFAFAPGTAIWIAFGLAVGATVLSLAGFGLALLRDSHAFSGVSALGALAAASTIVAVLVFAPPTAMWIAFAGGLVVLALALRSLALHETTIERVVHALEPVASEGGAPATQAARPAEATASRERLAVSAAMRSWIYWLAHTGIALAGAFVVAISFALAAPGHASIRWLSFGVGIGVTCVALAAMAERGGLFGERAGAGDRSRRERYVALLLSALSAGTGIALIVTMSVLGGAGARWTAFALGCAMAGASLVATAAHELTAERVRHELEIAAPAAERREPAAA